MLLLGLDPNCDFHITFDIFIWTKLGVKIIESYFLTYYIDISKTIYVYYLNRSHNLLKKKCN